MTKKQGQTNLNITGERPEDNPETPINARGQVGLIMENVAQEAASDRLQKKASTTHIMRARDGQRCASN